VTNERRNLTDNIEKGIKLATEFENGVGKGKFVCQIVGDGTFLFSVPGSVYWICQRYKIPILTIVLNNKGWNAPRKWAFTSSSVYEVS
jgi:thiamine pyrophosphate-dependent acetolactate synthase large subunit-like protein